VAVVVAEVVGVGRGDVVAPGIGFSSWFAASVCGLRVRSKPARVGVARSMEGTRRGRTRIQVGTSTWFLLDSRSRCQSAAVGVDRVRSSVDRWAGVRREDRTRDTFESLRIDHGRVGYSAEYAWRICSGYSEFPRVARGSSVSPPRLRSRIDVREGPVLVGWTNGVG